MIKKKRKCNIVKDKYITGSSTKVWFYVVCRIQVKKGYFSSTFYVIKYLKIHCRKKTYTANYTFLNVCTFEI